MRGLLARKLRTALTGFAVVIGVAFVAGTFVFTDTIDESFKDLFERVSKGVDVSVTAKKAVDAEFGGRPQPLPPGTLEKVRGHGRRGRRRRATSRPPSPSSTRTATASAGRPARRCCSPPRQERFDPLTYEEGEPGDRAGHGHDRPEDRRRTTASRSATRSSSPAASPRSAFEIVGITKLGDQKSLGLATLDMPLSEVQRIAREPGSVTEVVAAADDGTSPEQLKAAIDESLGGTATVRTGEEQAEQSAADISESLGFIKIALLVFAGVAVLVGGFLIFNTFAVTVAQRSREFALLRTLGASRRQVLTSVVVEAAVIGVAGLHRRASSAASCWRPALRALMAGFGLELPGTSTVVAPRTDHRRAPGRRDRHAGLGRHPRAPRHAGRSRRGDARGRHARRPPHRAPPHRRRPRRHRRSAWRPSSWACSAARAAPRRPSLLGLGVVIMIFGVALLAPILVKPLARVIGAPMQRFQGLPGRLARENAERQPQRTAITASALMIGLALVVFTAIFADGLRASVNKVIDDQFGRSALIVTHDDGFSPVPAGVGEELRRPARRHHRLGHALRPGQDPRRAATRCPPAASTPSTITEVFRPEWEEGSDATLAGLRDDQVLADAGWAEGNGFAVGDTLQVTTPANETLDYEIAGLYRNQAGALGNIIVTNASMSRDWNQPDDALVLVGGTADPDTLAREARGALSDFPVAKAQTLEQFKDEQAEQVNQLLGLIFALLSLSVIVALLGIVNTLALAVYERTRELGMLRAVGMSRRQVRRMVRAEAVITALIGAVLGRRARHGVRDHRVAAAGGRGLRALHPGRDADRARRAGRDRRRARGHPARAPRLARRRAAGGDEE